MTHFIQKIIYDINIPSEAQSNWLWEEISRLQQYELEAIIETTLDAFSLPNKTIRLEQLELDLGDIQAEDLKNDLPKLLANTLRKALEKQLSQSAEEIEEIKKQHFKGYDSPEANEIQAIVYFLQQGILPETLKVQLEEGEVLDINTLFQKQLTENTTKFLQQLQPLRADQDALRRLTTQFSETSYTLLIEKLAVEKQDFIQTTEQRLIALLSAQFQGKSITQQEIVAMVRQQILRILLGNLNGSFEEATFLEALFEGLQNAYNSEPLDFILHKNQVFLLQNKENNRFEVLQEQGFTIDANLISSNDVLEKTLQTPILQLFDNITQGLDFIQYVLLHHQTPWWAARLVITDLDTLILEIHKADKPKLEQMLKMVFSSSYLDKKTTIDSLVQRLPSSTIDLLLQTIEPDRYGFIQTVVLAVTRWAERRGVAISGYTDAQKGAQAAIIDYVASKKSNDFSIQNLVSHTLIVLSEAAKTSVAVEEKWFSEIVQAAVAKNETRFLVLEQVLRSDRSRPVEHDNDRSRPVQDDNDRSRPVEHDNDRSRPVEHDKDRSRPVQDDNDRSRPVEHDNDRSRPVQDDNDRSRPVQDDDDRSRAVRTDYLSAVLLNDAVPWWGNEIAVSSLDALITELYKEDKVTFEKTIKTIFSTVSDISVLKKSILERVAVENIELMLEVLELDKKKLIEPLLEQKRNPKGTLSRRLEYLEYIWLNDALPSWSDEMEVGNLDQLLNDLFYNHKDEFEKAIKKLLLTPSLTINRTLESLLSRFSVESISLFIQAIEPAMAGFIQTMVLVIERWTTRRRQIIAGTTDATRGGLWIVLHYLFSKKDTPFDTLALVEHTVRRLAENAKTDAATETKWLREIVVSAVTKNETRFMVVQQILDNPQFLSTPSPTETLAMQPDDWDTARQFDYFEYLVLNNALPWWSNKKNSPSLQNVYETLEKTAKIELEARLKRLFTESENNIETVVESLVERLDEAILQRILAHLEPDFIVFMQTVRLVLERWSAQQNLRIHAVIDNAKAPYALLFIYLLEKKTSAFDMAAALRSVINQLAAGRSISEKSIAQQWLDLVSVAVIAASEERFATIQQLLQRQLEDDIYFDIPMFMGDAPGEATWITEDTSATTPSILDTIYTTRQTLVWWEHFLNYGSLPGEVTLSLEQFVELLDELLQKLKGRTIQIARTLDFDRLVKNQLLGSLPSDFLQRWVHATMPTQSNVVWATYETYLLLIKNTPEKIVLSEQTLRQHLFIYSVRQREAGYSEFGYFTDLVRFTSRIQQVRGIEILEQLRSAVPVSDLTQTQATTFNATFQLAEKNLARALQQAPAALETTDTKTEDLSIGYKPQLEDVPIEILNAGLVLVWPFLPHLFTKLNLLTPEKKWISVEAQQRGVHLSQYLVSKQSSSPEFVLPLNKILCGMSINSPISKGIEMTEEEIEVCEGLLTAVTAQWSALKNTSPDGLRGAFLVRNGVLTKDGMNDGKWFLRVEKKPFDLLLQKLPWGMSMVRYTWSKNLVLVDWSSGVG